jgi:hypothetical protein
MERPQSRLLELPGELRNQILRHLVTQRAPIDLYHAKAELDIDLNVLYVCKQLKEEATAFIYSENTLKVIIESRGTVSSLNFSKYHSICEYRGEEAVQEVHTLYLERFSHFQFQFTGARRSSSLHTILSDIKQHFDNKHVTILLPPTKEAKAIIQGMAPARSTLYPRLNSLLGSFSLFRCASFSVIGAQPGQDLSEHEKLIDVVQSQRPVVDMTREYESAQVSARNVERMLVPDGFFQDYDRLRVDILARLALMCESAKESDLDTFLAHQQEFQSCYKKIDELQWRSP